MRPNSPYFCVRHYSSWLLIADQLLKATIRFNYFQVLEDNFW